MSFLTTLLTQLVVIATGLLYMPVAHSEVTELLYTPVAHSEVNCNSPIEAVLHGNATPNIVKFDGGVTSLPLGADLRITLPTSLVNKPGTKTFACIRWQSTGAENLAEGEIKRLDPWTKNLPIRVVDTKSDISIINVGMPDSIKERMDGSNPYTDNWWRPWANAELRLIVNDNDNDATVLDTVLDLQIVSNRFAATVAIVITGIFWVIFYSGSM